MKLRQETVNLPGAFEFCPLYLMEKAERVTEAGEQYSTLGGGWWGLIGGELSALWTASHSVAISLDIC